MITPWLNGLPWKPYDYRGDGTDTRTPPDLAAELEEAERRELEERVRAIIAARHGRVPLQPCGTLAAYQRHMRRNQEPCDACREASRQAQRERKGAFAP